LDCFNVLMSKIKFSKINKKYYFDVFFSKNYFKKQLSPHFKTTP